MVKMPQLNQKRFAYAAIFQDYKPITSHDFASLTGRELQIQVLQLFEKVVCPYGLLRFTPHPLVHYFVYQVCDGGPGITPFQALFKKSIILRVRMAHMRPHCQINCLCIELLCCRRSSNSPAVLQARVRRDLLGLVMWAARVNGMDLLGKLCNVSRVSLLAKYGCALPGVGSVSFIDSSTGICPVLMRSARVSPSTSSRTRKFVPPDSSSP